MRPHEGISEIQMQDLRLPIYKNNSAEQAGEGQSFGVNIVFVGLIYERYGKDSWRDVSECDALD